MPKEQSSHPRSEKTQIRSDQDCPYPFGLEISESCKCAGVLVDKMGAVTPDMSEEEFEELKEVNQGLLNWKCENEKCKYAVKLFPGHDDVVQCNFGETGEIQDPALVGSPFFWKFFSGVGMDGFYSYPLGYYSDNSIDRGIYYGMYSLEAPGSEAVDKLEKLSNKKQ